FPSALPFFFSALPPPSPTLFPYTTLFRSKATPLAVASVCAVLGECLAVVFCRHGGGFPFTVEKERGRPRLGPPSGWLLAALVVDHRPDQVARLLIGGVDELVGQGLGRLLLVGDDLVFGGLGLLLGHGGGIRSEERRVGEEGRSRWWPER